MSRIASAALLIAASLSPTPGAFAQEAPAALTVADYARAEGRLAGQANPLVLGASVIPVWLEDGRFWYRNRFEGGSEYVIVDPAARTRARAFDHARMAAALAAATGEEHTAFALPFGDLALEAGTIRFEVEVEGETYACGLDPDRCRGGPGSPRAPRPAASTSCRRTGRRRPSSATTTCGSATCPPGRRRDSPRTGSRTSATRRTTRAG